MISFGVKLKQARTDLGWTVDEVSHRSKIHPRLINKLEEDDYSVFSSPVYVKSFLRKYSGCVGLDFDAELANLEFVGFSTLDSYFACKTIVGSLRKNEISGMTKKFQRTQSKNETPIFLVGSVVALVCLLASFYYSGSQANIPIAGARDELYDFESRGNSFSRDSVVKSRLIATKDTVRPIETAGLAPVTLGSIKEEKNIQTADESDIQRIDPTSDY